MDMIGFPILLAALLGYVIFGGSSGDSGSGELSGEGIDPSDGDDDGALTSGDDIFNALGGDDRIAAGDGNDTVDGDAGDDILLGELGDDVLRGGEGNDTLYGGFGDDTLEDDAGDIFMFGFGGDDTLTAENGTGRMGGGDGDDTLTATDANVTILGGDGADQISATGGADVKAFAGPGDDLVTTDDTLGYYVNGDLGDDRIAGVGGRADGGEGDDILASYGSYDEDDAIAQTETEDPRTALYGGDGDDQLWGVEGNTIMTGGEGADEFHNQHRATIEDFEPGKDILILDIVYDDSDIQEGGEGVTVDAADFEIVLTEIEINGVPSTLVEAQVSAGATDPVDATNLNQTVWLKGVTPDELGDDDIDVSIVSQSAMDQILAETFAPA